MDHVVDGGNVGAHRRLHNVEAHRVPVIYLAARTDLHGHRPLRVRTALVPAANLGCRLGIPLVILGLILGLNSTLAMIGVWVFAISVLFQIVTLPVEYNASGRALRMLGSYHILSEQETGMVRKVLSAAALTYVAAAASSVLQLLRLWLLAGGRRRDD